MPGFKEPITLRKPIGQRTVFIDGKKQIVHIYAAGPKVRLQPIKAARIQHPGTAQKPMAQPRETNSQNEARRPKKPIKQ